MASPSRQDASSISYWVDHTVSPIDSTLPKTVSMVSVNLNPILRSKVSGVQIIILSTITDVYLHEFVGKRSPPLESTYTTQNVVGDNARRFKLTLALELRTNPKCRSTPAPLQIVPVLRKQLCSQPPARIIFKKDLPMLDSDSAITILLQSTEAFDPTEGFWPQTVWSNTFTITPTSSIGRNISPFSKLPRHLLHIVAHNTCNEFGKPLKRDIRDLKGILSIALVCKGWKSVVEVYFQQVGSCSGLRPINNPRGLVGSLASQPQMRNHFRKFSCLKVAGHWKPKCASYCVDIIALCPMLEDLQIAYQIYMLAKPALTQLVHVRAFHIPFTWISDMTERVDTIFGIYEVIKLWNQLESLAVTISAVSESSSGEKIGILLPFAAPFSLKELCIKNFRSPTHDIEHICYLLRSTPTLHTLKLYDIKGISTTELRKLLVYLAPTLERLKLKYCMPSQAADETNDSEAPIDAVLPSLTRIQNMHVGYPLATPLTISGKLFSSDHTHTPTAAKPWQDCCRLKWVNTGCTEFDEITRALEVTGWHNIIIHNSLDDGLELPAGVERLWKNIGKRRGLILEIK